MQFHAVVIVTEKSFSFAKLCQFDDETNDLLINPQLCQWLMRKKCCMVESGKFNRYGNIIKVEMSWFYGWDHDQIKYYIKWSIYTFYSSK